MNTFEEQTVRYEKEEYYPVAWYYFHYHSDYCTVIIIRESGAKR